MLVDSHCHLNYLDDPEAALASGRAAGVGGVLCIGVEQATQHDVLRLAEQHEDVWASAGLHPEAAASGSPEWINEVLDHPQLVALGEMGLDFYRVPDDLSVKKQQQHCFDYQLALARQHRLPAVIHTRAAPEATAELLRMHAGVTGVLHCFTESWDLAKIALDLGYYIGISGIATFKNGGNVREVAARVPRDRLLVETDAPWLAPVPHRGQQNQPAFVANTARFLADWLDWDFDALAAQTTANFHSLFARAGASS